jgi:hypothetical protein
MLLPFSDREKDSSFKALLVLLKPARKKCVFLWLPVVVLCLAIFIPSAFPSPDLGFSFPLKDKLLTDFHLFTQHKKMDGCLLSANRSIHRVSPALWIDKRVDL